MKAPPIVETPRLVLSMPVATDADVVFRRYASDDDVTRYLGWPTHRTIADTQGKKEPHRMTARRFAINVLIFAIVIIVMTAVAIWLNLGPVARSAA